MESLFALQEVSSCAFLRVVQVSLDEARSNAYQLQ